MTTVIALTGHTAVVDQTPDLVPRKAQQLIADALSDTRVVAINGARQAGKSTLARLTAQSGPSALVRLLDDPATLRAARDDPAGFVDHDGLLVIDEVQLAPELFRSIKVAVDTDPRPGRFLLTGSAQILALRQLPDGLLPFGVVGEPQRGARPGPPRADDLTGLRAVFQGGGRRSCLPHPEPGRPHAQAPRQTTSELSHI